MPQRGDSLPNEKFREGRQLAPGWTDSKDAEPGGLSPDWLD